jgi:hypothetical protein
LTCKLIAFSPDRHFCTTKKRGFRRKFVMADDGIQKFRVQLDGYSWFDWFGRFGFSTGSHLDIRHLRD